MKGRGERGVSGGGYQTNETVTKPRGLPPLQKKRFTRTGRSMNAKEMSIYSKVGMEEKCVTVGFGGIRQMIFSQNLRIYERD